MMNMLKTVVAAAMVFAASIGAHAADSQKVDEVLVIVTSESLQTQGMAMVLSSTMAQQGAKVNILLCDTAGDLALQQYDAPALRPNKVTRSQMMRGLLQQGATANVCALYLPNSDYSKEDLIDGVGVATPPDMAAQMLDPGIRVFSF